MFERFTERARAVIVLAQEEARGLNHAYIGVEHLLLGLLREEEGIAARVLNYLGITDADARGDLKRIVGKGDETTEGQIPFTPRANKVLELALREALSLGHNYIGTEHVLLGLVRESEGTAAQILNERSIDSERVRQEVVRMLSGTAKPAVPVEVEPAPETGLTRLLTKSGECLLVSFDIEGVIASVFECGEGLIGFRCIDDRMRYVAKDQVAFVEPFHG